MPVNILDDTIASHDSKRRSIATKVNQGWTKNDTMLHFVPHGYVKTIKVKQSIHIIIYLLLNELVFICTLYADHTMVYIAIL